MTFSGVTIIMSKPNSKAMNLESTTLNLVLEEGSNNTITYGGVESSEGIKLDNSSLFISGEGGRLTMGNKPGPSGLAISGVESTVAITGGIITLNGPIHMDGGTLIIGPEATVDGIALQLLDYDAGFVFVNDAKEAKVQGDPVLPVDLTIPEGYTLNVLAGTSLTVPEGVTLTVDGAIRVETGGSITGAENISGTVQHKLTEDMVEIEADSYTYTGEAITPKVTIKGYTQDTDYKVTYENNTNAGEEATITITPTETGGLYGDAVTMYFTISQATPTFAKDWSVKGKTYDGEQISITVPVLNGVGDETIVDGVTLSYKGKEEADDAYTATAPMNAGEYVVKATFAGNDNYTAATDATAEFTIEKAPLTIDLNIVEKATYNGQPVEATATVKGVGEEKFEVTSLVYQRKGEGDSWTDLEGAPTDAGEYVVKATFAGNTNYTAAEDTKEFTIAKVEPTIELNIAEKVTYNGQPVEATATVKGVGEDKLEATLVYQRKEDDSWTDLEEAPTDAGDYKVKATFAESDNYKAAEATAEFTIEKAEPEFTPVPSDLTATYGQKLAEVELPEGWEWEDNTLSVGNAGSNTFKATFTPDDTDNYTVVKGIELTVTVGKADPTPQETPGSYTATVGEQLSSVELPDGWKWKEEEVTLEEEGDQLFTAIFTPEDTKNYNTIEQEVTITVNPEPESEPEPEPEPTPDPEPTYYRVDLRPVEGATIIPSAQWVEEGGTLTFTVEIEEGYVADGMVVTVSQGAGKAVEVEPDAEGVYTVRNVDGRVTITVYGVEEATPVGVETIDGVRVYSYEGAIYVHTPTEKRVMIVAMNGVLKANGEQVGKRRYELPRGFYVVWVDGASFKVAN